MQHALAPSGKQERSGHGRERRDRGGYAKRGDLDRVGAGGSHALRWRRWERELRLQAGRDQNHSENDEERETGNGKRRGRSPMLHASRCSLVISRGGSVWESNPPEPPLASPSGFE